MIFLQIFICLAALYVFLMHPRIRRADSSPFLGTFFAHRGLHDNNHQIPENSLAAFQRAVDAGYGMSSFLPTRSLLSSMMQPSAECAVSTDG